MKKFWTDAKIAETLSKERVLKSETGRRPRTYLTNLTLAKLVSERNGFMVDNVKEVLDDCMEIIWENLLEGHKVQLAKMGSLYITVKPPYKTNINLKGLGGELKEHYVSPRFDLRFQRNEVALNFLKMREVKESELDKMYISLTDTKQVDTELVVKTTPQTRKM